MTISDEAVEAAVIAAHGSPRKDNKTLQKAMRVILEAAAPHMLAGAWEAGAAEAWSRSTPEVNGAAYKWRHEGEPINPYRSQA